MEKTKDIDWQEEIRRMIIDRVRQETKKRLLEEAKEIRKKMKSSSISEMIREDRDSR